QDLCLQPGYCLQEGVLMLSWSVMPTWTIAVALIGLLLNIMCRNGSILSLNGLKECQEVLLLLHARGARPGIGTMSSFAFYGLLQETSSRRCRPMIVPVSWK